MVDLAEQVRTEEDAGSHSAENSRFPLRGEVAWMTGHDSYLPNLDRTFSFAVVSVGP